MKKIVIFFTVMLLVVLSACSEEVVVNEPSRLKEGSVEFTAETLPKICATRYTQKAALNTISAVLGCDENAAKSILIVCDTTDECYEKLIKNECDIVLAHDYGSSVKELLGTTALSFTSTEITKDALVFYTNGSHGVCDISLEQLTGVYKGETTDWSALGGAEMPITLFGQPKKTAVQNAFEKYIPDAKEIPAVTRPLTTEKGSFSAEVDYDNRDGALGYTLLSLADGFFGGSIKPLNIGSVAPTKENIEANTYPLTVSVSIVIRSSEVSGNTRVLYDWMLSEQGKAVLSCFN